MLVAQQWQWHFPVPNLPDQGHNGEYAIGKRCPVPGLSFRCQMPQECVFSSLFRFYNQPNIDSSTTQDCLCLALIVLLLSDIQEMTCHPQSFGHSPCLLNQIEPGFSLLKCKFEQILFVPLRERFDTYQRDLVKICEIGTKLRAGSHMDCRRHAWFRRPEISGFDIWC